MWNSILLCPKYRIDPSAKMSNSQGVTSYEPSTLCAHSKMLIDPTKAKAYGCNNILSVHGTLQMPLTQPQMTSDSDRDLEHFMPHLPSAASSRACPQYTHSLWKTFSWQLMHWAQYPSACTTQDRSAEQTGSHVAGSGAGVGDGVGALQELSGQMLVQPMPSPHLSQQLFCMAKRILAGHSMGRKCTIGLSPILSLSTSAPKTFRWYS